MIDKKSNDVCFVSILRQCGPHLKNELQMLIELMLIKESIFINDRISSHVNIEELKNKISNRG